MHYDFHYYYYVISKASMCDYCYYYACYLRYDVSIIDTVYICIYIYIYIFI